MHDLAADFATDRLFYTARHGASRPDVARTEGDRKGTWSVSVNGNWRVTFSSDGKDVVDVDYEDYHSSVSSFYGHQRDSLISTR